MQRPSGETRSPSSEGEPNVDLALTVEMDEFVDGKHDFPQTSSCPILCLEDEDEMEKSKSAGDLCNLSWKSEPEDYDNKKWTRVDSVMDSGASAPVAPPQVMPSVPIEPLEGSRRGQKYSSASKHKLKNLGQQKIKACTEAGEETEVLFQVADVSKPLVSVSAICERGNRVIFGRAGGVVQNVKTGKVIPFVRQNGIYILSLWMAEGEGEQGSPSTAPFGRR